MVAHGWPPPPTITTTPPRLQALIFCAGAGLARSAYKIVIDLPCSSGYYPCMNLTMEVGDIWLFDTSAILGNGADIYGRPLSKREHWLILDVNTTLSNVMDKTIVQYLCLEDGTQRDKMFNNIFDFRGNPYYKKVA